MSDGWLDSTMQAINDRIKSPLWGYIILAWVWFNWPNLAMLFMSDAPVKFRIDYILSQEYFYLLFVVRPIIAGCLLAIASPYIQLLLSKAHEWADDRHSKVVAKIKKRQLKDAIELAKLQVEADRAKEIINHEIDIDKKIKEEYLKQEQLNTESVKEELEQLRIEIEKLGEVKENIRRARDKYVSDARRHHFDVARLLGLITSVINSTSIDELLEFKEKANLIVSSTELDKAVLKNKIDLNENLTDEELVRILDYMGDSLSKKEQSEIRSQLESREDIDELAND
ncbi:hypothetical protein [Escherichia coli]|uniref:hypothetical protein n=1 Tax=Escherichia coli TaxID=562 RepID=UPI0029299277|nr:hypothetical protein [Escherichia coli]ELO3161961.1 hypothetical protein [Escherichia coli]HCC5740624.1 hypothetical protein [Escherichia coli]HCC7756199.1 hypothetical protein [Escherichia coli]HCP1542156.1 hypothetical protein [Escherichia coli]